MQRLKQKTLLSLDWNFIQNELATRCQSQLAKEWAQALDPLMAQPNEADFLRNLAIEGCSFLKVSNLHLSFAGIVDPTPTLQGLSLQRIYGAGDLRNTARFMLVLHEMKSIVRRSTPFDTTILASERLEISPDIPQLRAHYITAPEAPEVVHWILKHSDDNGYLLDSASTLLRQLRQQLQKKQSQLQSELSARTQKWATEGILQDNYFDVLDGRFVVPAKAARYQEIGGTIIRRSNSQSSFFVEPLEFTQVNNAIQELQAKVAEEEYRIVSEWSGALALHATHYLDWVEPFVDLDCALANARLALDWNLSPATTSSDGFLYLDQVTHPHFKTKLDSTPVSNRVEIEVPTRALLLSGPNTGGKTVLLKATALACLMHRAGLMIAAEPGARIPHYDHVVSLIGDEQDLTLGLSSFSGQVFDLKHLIEGSLVGQRNFIVIDEILSSTDPEEASALAQSFMERMINAGHHLFVSTHFSELTLRLKDHPHVLTGAMEFAKGKPTYKYRKGELGFSHAIETAERLQLPADIITRARELLSTAKIDYMKAQQELIHTQLDLQSEKNRVRIGLQKEKENFAMRLQKVEAQYQAKFQELRRDFDNKLNQFKELIPTSVTAAKRSEMITQLKETIDKAEIRSVILTDHPKQTAATKEKNKQIPLTVGCRVRISDLQGSTGIIVEINNNKARIQVGNFKIDRAIHMLSLVETARHQQGHQKVKIAFSSSDADDSLDSMSTRIDLRGLRLDDAKQAFEQYIDRCIRHGLRFFTVVTGHGTGAIKTMARKVLSQTPSVSKVSQANEGDDGALQVDLSF